MQRLMRHFRFAVFAATFAASGAMAQQSEAGPAASGVAAADANSDANSDANAKANAATPVTAPPMPQPDDSTAQRARSQPGNNAPFWRGVHDSGRAPGTVNNFAADRRGELIQKITQYPGTRTTTAGEAWRQIRNGWILPYGGALLLITLVALGLYYVVRGPIGGQHADGGRILQRFTYFERVAHWANAIAFCVLAISGIVMAFGKFLVLPWLGGTLFGPLTYALKTLHNFAGPLFVVSLVIVFFTFLRSNWLSRVDWMWLKQGGGLFGGAEPPSPRFNAGEKMVFWLGVFLLGSIVIGSGLVLDKVLPGLTYTRGEMQVAHIVHSIATVLMMAMFFGHIYIGTVGMKGAYHAMKTGEVDENWARLHHRYWYEDIKAGKVPRSRSKGAPATGIEQPAS